MKIKNSIWYIFILILFYSCYEDKGNYDYKPTIKMSVKEMVSNLDELGGRYSLKVGDVLKVSPVMEFTDGNPETLGLKYKWVIESSADNYTEEIGVGKDLEWKVSRGGFLTLYLFVTDTLTGYEIVNQDMHIRPQDISNMGYGWMILSEVDGETCFSYIEEVTESTPEGGVEFYYRETKDIYGMANEGQKLIGRPVKIMNHWAGSSSSNAEGMVLILQNEGESVYVSTRDFKRSLYLKDDFMNGQIPNVKFTDAVANRYSHVLLTDKGDLYMKAVEEPEVFFTGKYMDVPARIEKGMKIAYLVRTSYMEGGPTFAYDELNNRFLYIVNDNNLYNGDWGSANAIMELKPAPGETGSVNINNMNNLDVRYVGLYFDTEMAQWGEEKVTCFLVLYKDNRPTSSTYGKYRLYGFKFGMDPDTYEQYGYTKIDRVFPEAYQNRINDDSQYRLIANSRYQYMLFSSGANNSELWGYIFRGTGGTRPVRLFDFNGKKITSIATSDTGDGFSSSGTDLLVGLETGEVYIFMIKDDSFNQGDVNYFWKSNENYGAIRDMRYNGWAGQAL